MALIFSVFIFGLRVYDKGVSQNNIQEDIRFASDFITREMRSAKEVSDTKEEIVTNKKEYYTLEFKDNRLLYNKLNSSDDTLIESKILGNELISVKFWPEDKILLFEITAKDKDQEYSILNQVLINNLIDKNNKKMKFDETMKIFYIK